MRRNNNMNSNIISIIITVFNRENYIGKCIDSVLNQKDVNMEIIIIDDGSTDSSPIICDEYARNHSNIRIIHQKNSGLSVSRNVGLDNVKGDYIVFLDDDDVLADDSLSKMLNLLLKHDADFVMGNYDEYDDNGNFIKAFDIPRKYHDRLLSKREVCELFFIQSHVLVVSWGKIFKKKVWDDIRFPDAIVKSEDQFVFPALMEKCSKIYFINEIVYHQTMTRVSISRSKLSRKHLWNAEGILEVMKYLIKMRFYDIAVYKFGLGTRHIIYLQDKLQDTESKAEIKRLIKLYKNIAKKLIPHVSLKNKFRFALFVMNYECYLFFQNISARIYLRKLAKKSRI